MGGAALAAAGWELHELVGAGSESGRAGGAKQPAGPKLLAEGEEVEIATTVTEAGGERARCRGRERDRRLDQSRQIAGGADIARGKAI